MATVNLYSRGDAIYVAPSDGVADLEPVEVVRDQSKLRSAIERALDLAGRTPWEPRSLRNYKWPVLGAAGIKSAVQFERGVKFLMLECEDGRCTIQRYVPDIASGRGFDPGDILFTGDAVPVEELAFRVLESFDRSDWRVR
ncbi:MAG: hypothetical protein JWM87_2014 [Candidatus Eremiobacteraeota bacterium]|nr:hypothetical protein [Candidatus Eremiobacteraeota bacterium]